MILSELVLKIHKKMSEDSLGSLASFLLVSLLLLQLNVCQMQLRGDSGIFWSTVPGCSP